MSLISALLQGSIWSKHLNSGASRLPLHPWFCEDEKSSQLVFVRNTASSSRQERNKALEPGTMPTNQSWGRNKKHWICLQQSAKWQGRLKKKPFQQFHFITSFYSFLYLLPFNFLSFLDQILQKAPLLLKKLGCTHKALGQKEIQHYPYQCRNSNLHTEIELLASGRKSQIQCLLKWLINIWANTCLILPRCDCSLLQGSSLRTIHTI